MGGRNKKAPDTRFKITFEPCLLNETENNHRINRLAKKILACINSSMTNETDDGGVSELNKKEYKEVFGVA